MFNQDFKEFIESLNANLVRYLIVGGYAVALHGHPRYTKDPDVLYGRALFGSMGEGKGYYKNTRTRQLICWSVGSSWNKKQ
jgi:hypothetical protein